MQRASPSTVLKYRNRVVSQKTVAPPAEDVPGLERKHTFFFRHIRDFVNERIGERGIQVLNCVGDGATDEKIEEQTKLRISEIRSILNHLHSYGFVEYNRSKNMSNGWFTYTWKINMNRAMQNFLVMKTREYLELRNSLSSESGTVYRCRKGCNKLDFEEAFEKQFRCGVCNSDLRLFDGASERRKIESKISALEKILSNSSRKW